MKWNTLFKDGDYIKLSNEGKLIYFYLHLSEQTNLLGISQFSISEMAKSLNIKNLDVIKNSLKELEREGFILYDPDNSIVCITEYLFFNPLYLPNHIKSAIKLIRELPNSKVLELYFDNLNDPKLEILKDAYKKKVLENNNQRLIFKRLYSELNTQNNQINPTSETPIYNNKTEQTDAPENLIVSQISSHNEINQSLNENEPFNQAPVINNVLEDTNIPIFSIEQPNTNTNSATSKKGRKKSNTKNDEEIPYAEIIEHFNEITGSNYKHTTPETRRLIKARWEEGFRLDDFKKVIENMYWKWRLDMKMQQYIRPITLFTSKFESYLNTKVTLSDRGIVSDITERNMMIFQEWLNEEEAKGNTQTEEMKVEDVWEVVDERVRQN